MAETIKSKVIARVNKDPFLSIQEIAVQTGTTPRYVRTILSEARLSLLHLRKQYAKTMERQLGLGADTGEQERLYPPDLRLITTLQPAVANLLGQAPDTQLVKASRLEKLGSFPVYRELVTYLKLRLGAGGEPLKQLLILNEGCPVDQIRTWIEVVSTNPALGRLLVNDENQPLIKISHLLCQGTTPVALDIHWMQTEGILLKANAAKFEVAAEM